MSLYCCWPLIFNAYLKSLKKTLEETDVTVVRDPSLWAVEWRRKSYRPVDLIPYLVLNAFVATTTYVQSSIWKICQWLSVVNFLIKTGIRRDYTAQISRSFSWCQFDIANVNGVILRRDDWWRITVIQKLTSRPNRCYASAKHGVIVCNAYS